MDDKVEDMDVIDQHQIFSVYEPHYQQMHPLIFYEDTSGNHHHHHHPQQFHHHHHLHSGVAAVAHHHWDHEHFGVREICAEGSIKSEQDNRVEGNSVENVNNDNDTGEVEEDDNKNDDNNNNSINDYDDNEDDNQRASTKPEGMNHGTVSQTPTNRELHNEIERRRRLRIKQCCDILRTLVPGLSEKTDKATVLEHTVKFVNHLSKCPTFECKCEF